MFNLFARIKGKNRCRAYSLPEDLRIYAVGDIHGRADLLERLLDLIVLDAETGSGKENRLVFLGDYLDRGPYVRRTMELLAAGPPPGFSSIFLMGNHEQMFLDFLQDPSLLEMWMGLGGQSTLLSYGVQAPGSGFSLERARAVQEALLEAMPAGHLEFIRGLDRYHQAGDYFFVHAGVRPGVELPDQSLDDLLWIREYFLECDQEHQARVVHGHTVTDTVQECKNRIGIDTGAYATGILTCAVIEGSTIRYLDTSSRSKTFENHSA